MHTQLREPLHAEVQDLAVHRACAHTLVGAVVNGLDLRHHDLQSNAARDYFRDGNVRASSRARVLRAFHASLVDIVRMFGLITRRADLRMARVDRDSLIAMAVDAWDWNAQSGDGIDAAILDISIRLCGAALLCMPETGASVTTLDALSSAAPFEGVSSARGVTQERLAAMAGVDVRQVRRWLQGQSTPRDSRFRHIAEAMRKAEVGGANVVDDAEARLWRWFAARALKRALADRMGPLLTTRLTDAVPMLVRTLVQHLVVHPADIEMLRMGPEGGHLALLVYGTATMSLDAALDAIRHRAPSPEWRDIAKVRLAHERKQRESPPSFQVRRPPPEWGPWDTPNFLEGLRPLPTYGEVAATYADLALRKGRRRAAHHLATQAAERGELRALHAWKKTKRRPRAGGPHRVK